MVRGKFFRLGIVLLGGLILSGCNTVTREEYRRGAGLTYLTVKLDRSVQVSEGYGEMEGRLLEAVYLYDELVLPDQRIRLQFYRSIYPGYEGESNTLVLQVIGFYRENGSFRGIGSHSGRLLYSKPVELAPAGKDGYFRIVGSEVRLTHAYGPKTAARYIQQAY